MCRILLGLILLAASLSMHPFDRNQGSAQAQQIVLPCVPSGNSCIPVSAANPLPTTGGSGGGSITPGTTTCTSCAANNLLYTDGTLVQELATANSGVLVTSAGGVPSISTTLPSGLTIPGYLTSLVIGTTAITGGATTQVLFNNGGVLGSDSGFTYAGSGGQLQLNGDGILTSPAAATWQFGAANVNGAPVAQILQFQSALAGSATNQASATTNIVGSLGTGTGTNGDIVFKTGVKTSSGTTQATPTAVLTIKGESGGIIAGQAITVQGSTSIGSNIQVASSSSYVWGNGSRITSSGSGILQFQNNGNTQNFTIDTSATAGEADFQGGLAATLASASGTNAVCNIPGTATPLTVQAWATGCSVSSIRFKRDLEAIDDRNALDVMTRLQPLSYRYRMGQGDNGADIHFGFTAEQVRTVDPDLITLEADGITPHAVKYNELWAFASGAIRRLQTEIKALNAKLDKVEAHD
jgi:hypothetical protein